MVWLRLDDNFDDNPKTVEIGHEAAWLDVRGMLYCARHLTDGFIPDHQMPRIGSDFSQAKRKRLIGTLHAAGRWDRDDDKRGWWVHDYLIYNPSREEVEEQRRKRSEAGRIGGLTSGRSRRQAKGEASAEADASSKRSSKTEANANPVPARPVPKKSPIALKGDDVPKLPRQTVRTVRCPNCGAEPGRKCLGVSGGYERESNHMERVLAYVDAQVEEEIRRREMADCATCSGRSFILDDDDNAVDCPDCTPKLRVVQ